MGNSQSATNTSLLIGSSIAIVGGFLIYKLIFSSREAKCLTTLRDPLVKYPLELIAKEELTHDTRRLRFALSSTKHRLGIQLGHHVMLTARIYGDIVVRPYTPTSSVDQCGYFDLVLRIYKSNEQFPNGGKMSKYLDAMKLGDKIDVRGPTGRMVYKRNGLFELKFERNSPLTKIKVNHIGMIAGGTGITPMFQLINDICQNSEDKTKMSLVFSNRTQADILLQDELNAFVKSKPDQLNIWYTLTQSSQSVDWDYGTSRVNEEMLKVNLPSPGEGVLILLCGPPGMVKCSVSILKNMGYTKEMIYVC